VGQGVKGGSGWKRRKGDDFEFWMLGFGFWMIRVDGRW